MVPGSDRTLSSIPSNTGPVGGMDVAKVVPVATTANRCFVCQSCSGGSAAGVATGPVAERELYAVGNHVLFVCHITRGATVRPWTSTGGRELGDVLSSSHAGSTGLTGVYHGVQSSMECSWFVVFCFVWVFGWRFVGFGGYIVLFGGELGSGFVRGFVSDSPYSARGVNRRLNRDVASKYIVTFLNKLNVNGAYFAHKLTEKLNSGSTIASPAFTLMGRCLDKQLPLCRFSVCHVSK